MKYKDITEGLDSGDFHLHNTINASTAARSAVVRGYWLLDRATGKKLSGPFKDQEAANSFKTNRPDRIPTTAVVKFLDR